MENTEFGPPEKKRWYILLVFAMLTAFQSNTWFTFSSVPSKVEEYYHLHKPSDSSKVNPTIDLWLNWAPMLFVFIAPFAGYFLLYPITGLKLTVRIASTLVLIANCVRCIPTILELFTNYSINNNLFHTLIFIHIAQIINSMAGPLVLAPPSKLSVIWFPEKQRVLATGIGAGANTFGTCLGFLIGPLIVSKSSDLPYLLYFDTLLAFIPFILSWIYFPNSPNKLPSAASKQALHAIPNKSPIKQINVNDDMHNFQKLDSVSFIDKDPIDPNIEKHLNTNKLSFITHCVDFIYEIKNLLTSPRSCIIGVIGGLAGGIFAGWAGVLQDMLSPLDLNDTQIGLIGFNISIMTAFGGFISGPIADYCFNKKLKRLIMILYVIVIINMLILFFVLPSPFSDKSLIIISSNSTISYKMIICNILIGFLGFFSGCLVAPYYELIAEVSYPISEGTSALYLTTINALGVMLFVGIGSWLNTKYETFLVTIICITSLGILKFVKEEYKRP